MTRSIFYILFLAILCFNIGSAQTFNSTEDIHDYYHTLQTDTEKYELIKNYVQSKKRNADETLSLLLKEVAESQLAKGDTTDIMEIVNTLLYYYYNKGMADSIFSYHQRLEPYINRYKSSEVAEFKANIGNAYYAILDLPSSYEYYIQAGEMFREVGDTNRILYGRIYLYAADNAKEMGQFATAVQDFETAKNIFTSHADTTNYLWAAYGQITLLGTLGFFEEVEEKQTEILEIAKKIDAKEIVFAVQTVIVAMGQKLNQYEKTRKSIREMVAVCGDFQLYSYCYEAYHSATLLFLSTGELDSAEYYLNLLTEMSGTFNKNAVLNSNYNLVKARLAFAKGEIEKAQNILDNNFYSRNQIKTVSNKVNVLRLQYSIDTTLKNYKKASHSLGKLKSLTDSLNQATLKNQFLYYQTLFETNKRRQEIAEKEEQITQIELSNRTERFFWGIGILSIITLGAILYYIYRRRQSIRDKRRQEKYSRDLLMAQEVERKIISSHIDKHIGQNLHSIKAQIRTGDKELTSVLVKSTLEEVRRVSRVLHPFVLENLGLTAAIERLASETELRGDLFIETIIDDNIDNLLVYEHNLNLYRIIQEGLNNILDHAEAEAAKLLIQKLPQQLKISIIDYGKGFYVEHSTDFSAGMGLKTMQERTKMSNGTITIFSKKSAGTTIQILIPIPRT